MKIKTRSYNQFITHIPNHERIQQKKPKGPPSSYITNIFQTYTPNVWIRTIHKPRKPTFSHHKNYFVCCA